MNNIYILLVAALGIPIGYAIYEIQAYLRSDYFCGKSMARKYIDSIVPKESIFEDTEERKTFQDNTFKKALGAKRDEFNEQIVSLKEKIEKFEKSISKLEEKKYTIINTNHELVSQEGRSVDGENFEADKKRIKDELKNIDGEIKKQEEKLSVAREDMLEKEKEGNKKPHTLHTMSWFKARWGKISELSKRSNAIWFWFFLVLIDYILSISFFADWAESFNQALLLKIAAGYFLPLGITIGVLWFMHKVFDCGREGSIRKAAWLAIIPCITMVCILIMRLNSPDPKDQSLLFWEFFVLIVIAIGYGCTEPKQSISVWEIIKIPAHIIFSIITIVIILILWPLECILGFFPKSKSPEAKFVSGIKKHIDKLWQNKEYKKAEYDEICKQEQEIRENIDNKNRKDRQRINNRRTWDIKNLEKLIKIDKKAMGRIEILKQKWEKRLANLHCGSDVGVMTGLKKIKKQKIA